MRTTETVRGQTTIDFGVGMGVFLLTLVFVVAYAPTVFDPVAGGTGSASMTADRAATTLSGDVLAASTAEPGILSVGCVAEFFGEVVEGTECEKTAGFSEFDGSPPFEDRNLNVTIHELDAPVSDPARPEWASADLQQPMGGPEPSTEAVATRTVSIDGKLYRLTVRVW
ncbi:hypothetical protein [Natronomonas sp. LN261]|uniref:DUF7287 family protein n=1 Tax=Natronomonas sp. LN261 TaxID=2750669 RepID=UPI0015EF6260|nr:hypothetical protein [Natronomonas sp. LN261]